MTKLSANFDDSEFRCPCCGKSEVAGTLVLKLQELRDIINKPIHITSGYRCPVENKKIGGYGKSPHLDGLAVDIQVKGMPIITLANMAASNIVGIRIGCYPNHIHVDIVKPHPSKYWLVKRYGQKAIYSGNEKNLAKFLKKNL